MNIDLEVEVMMHHAANHYIEYCESMVKETEGEPALNRYWQNERIKAKAHQQWLATHARQIGLVEKIEHPQLSI